MPCLELQAPLRPLWGKLRCRSGLHSRLVATTPLGLLVGLPLRVSVLRRVLLRLRVLWLAVLLLLVRPGARLEPGGRLPRSVRC